jgi:hypothetical protein
VDTQSVRDLLLLEAEVEAAFFDVLADVSAVLKGIP